MTKQHMARTVRARWAIGECQRSRASSDSLPAAVLPGATDSSSGNDSSSGASTASGASSRSPILIGFVGRCPGLSAAPAALEQQSLEVWSAAVNKSGGILGRSLQVQYIDDQDSAAQAMQAVRKLTGEGVQIVFGPILFPMAVQPLRVRGQFHGLRAVPEPAASRPGGLPVYVQLHPPAGEDGVSQIAPYLAAHGKTKGAVVADTTPASQVFQGLRARPAGPRHRRRQNQLRPEHDRFLRDCGPDKAVGRAGRLPSTRSVRPCRDSCQRWLRPG